MNIYLLFIVSFAILTSLYFFYKFSKSVGIKEASLNALNDSLRQEEVKRNEYITKTKRIEKEFPKLKTTSTISASLASQLLSGKVIKFKNTKT